MRGPLTPSESLRLEALDRALAFFAGEPATGDDVLETASEFEKFLKGERTE